MRLKLNVTYEVLKTDGTHVRFTFVGNELNDNTLYVELGGQRIPLYDILKDGYLAYTEVKTANK